MWSAPMCSNCVRHTDTVTAPPPHCLRWTVLLGVHRRWRVSLVRPPLRATRRGCRGRYAPTGQRGDGHVVCIGGSGRHQVRDQRRLCVLCGDLAGTRLLYHIAPLRNSRDAAQVGTASGAMTKMDEASNPCGGDIEAEMRASWMREQPPAGVVDRRAATPSKRCVDHAGAIRRRRTHLTYELRPAEAAVGRSRRRISCSGGAAGAKAFVAAGADIKESNTRMSAPDAAEWPTSLAVCLEGVGPRCRSQPRSGAVGGGCELATACDVCTRPTTRASATWAGQARRRVYRGGHRRAPHRSGGAGRARCSAENHRH